MKKILLCFVVSASIFACTNPASKEAVTTAEKPGVIEHIYKPIYTDTFKIGDQQNVLVAEKMHQAMFAKDFKQVGEYLSDSTVFNLEDGSKIKGKAAVLAYMEANFSQVNIKNYRLIADMPIVGANGHQWVFVFDAGDVETPDGKTTKYEWMDAVRFENGKVVQFEGFAKSPK